MNIGKNFSFKATYANALLFFVALVWGAGFVAIDIVFKNYSTFQLLSGRFFIGAMALTIVFNKKLKNVKSYEIIGGVIVGMLLIASFAFQVYGQYYSTASINAFVTAVYVILIPIFQHFIFGKKVKKKIVFSGILTFIGILCISFGSAEESTSINVILGVFLTLIGACGYAMQTIFVEKFVSGKKPIEPLLITIFMLWTSFAVSFIIGIILILMRIDKIPQFDDNFIKSTLGIVFLGLFSTAIAFLGQNVAQRYTSASKTAIILSLESVFGAIFSALILNEKFSFQIIIGFIIVFMAVLIAEEILFSNKQ